MDDLARNGRKQRVVQIAAMHAEIRRVVEAFGHRQFARDFAGVAHAIEMRVRRERGLAQPRFDADAAQHLHRVRHHLDAGADAREAARLLVDLHLHADLPQRGGGSEPAHSGTDDRDRALAHRRYFFSMPALTMTSSHFFTSALNSVISSSGVLGFASMPMSSRRCLTSGIARTSFSVALTVLTTRGGVPRGANTPFQDVTS